MEHGDRDPALMYHPSDTFSGGCLCGAVRYEVVGPPRSVAYCHCRICQRSTGAPTTVWAAFPAIGFRVVAGSPAYYRSSDTGVRCFCATCGTQLYFTSGQPGATEVAITTPSLDDPSVLPPQLHLWSDSKPEWLLLADNLPHLADAGLQ
eukprot:TRINITY_DN27401_c0_g1_i1.p1 TRINITY_DN27401_c0_g1~~TRINITY_DN27401_c0_g1_i1.p1  ORF type:complete len:149 (+),score=21.00 TRINITY_DN27401_c0_g1_i1:80-526(+)